MSRAAITLPAPEAAGAYLAARKLGKVAGLPASLRYALAGLARSLEGPYRDLAEEELATLTRHAAKDAQGKLIPRTNEAGESIPNSFRFASEEDAAACRAELDELNHQEAVIEYTPIPIERYLERMDEHNVEVPEGTLETLWPFFAAEAGSE